MESSNFGSQHSMLPPLDLGTPWMADVLAAKMIQIQEEISPCNMSNLQRRNAMRCPAENVTMIEREDEACTLQRTNAVRRKRTNTQSTDLSADTAAVTEASVDQGRTKENDYHEGLMDAVGGPQMGVSWRPSRFTEQLIEDEKEPIQGKSSHAGIAKAVLKMRACLKRHAAMTSRY